MPKQTVAIFERGKDYREADVIRVFATKEKAIAEIPDGFKHIDPGDYGYVEGYQAENEQLEEWISIVEYEVE